MYWEIIPNKCMKNRVITFKNICRPISKRTTLTVSILFGREFMMFINNSMALLVFMSPEVRTFVKLTPSEILSYYREKEREREKYKEIYNIFKKKCNGIHG